MKTYISNCRLVLPDEILENSSLLLEDGVIREIAPESGLGAKEIDLAGKILMPGMIDLHCDALEKEVEPRPNVHFPFNYGCAQADKRNAAAGITTVFHSLSFAGEELGVRNNEMAATLVKAMHDWRPHGLVDNRIHCRYEITNEAALPVVSDLLDNKMAHLVSLMDHTPGQGQFKDMAGYRSYLAKTYKKDEKELDRLMEEKLLGSEGAYHRIQTLAECAHRNGIAIASHDDDSPERIATMRKIGANISEFPITLEAAAAAQRAGMATVFGAPNILRGKSQAGSMRAIDAIHADVADCLCADYAPAALIVSVFCVPEQSTLNLAEAVRLVTSNPAQAAGLKDRGEIKEGKRADLIAVDQPGGLPQICRVWVKGIEVFKTVYDHG
ncbi:MAG: alpha-D-ribose 1-methylphosphonate 5-triphosphate diphosphatase [Thermodesulfobacteriota bacterium]|nr:alpha-D-ribose 1-methylphosphonate 5-triphosphate diphosphatase [Thermodesulfobacteriota bacterium]